MSRELSCSEKEMKNHKTSNSKRIPKASPPPENSDNKAAPTQMQEKKSKAGSHLSEGLNSFQELVIYIISLVLLVFFFVIIIIGAIPILTVIKLIKNVTGKTIAGTVSQITVFDESHYLSFSLKEIDMTFKVNIDDNSSFVKVNVFGDYKILPHKIKVGDFISVKYIPKSLWILKIQEK